MNYYSEFIKTILIYYTAKTLSDGQLERQIQGMDGLKGPMHKSVASHKGRVTFCNAAVSHCCPANVFYFCKMPAYDFINN